VEARSCRTAAPFWHASRGPLLLVIVKLIVLELLLPLLLIVQELPLLLQPFRNSLATTQVS
jgi:hypothetical protein